MASTGEAALLGDLVDQPILAQLIDRTCDPTCNDISMGGEPVEAANARAKWKLLIPAISAR